MDDKSGVVRKAPCGESSGAWNNLSGKGAGAALNADLDSREVPKAGSRAPNLGLNSNAIKPEGEATAKKTDLG